MVITLPSQGIFYCEVIMYSVIDRLKEPSTHAGICGIIYGIGMLFPQYTAITSVIALLFGGSAVVIPEQK